MPAMSNNRSEKGRLGEEYAARLLEREGYRILSRNFHTRYGEIDLIAQKGEILAFIEVKTRAADSLSRSGGSRFTAEAKPDHSGRRGLSSTLSNRPSAAFRCG